ncbi:MAG: MATE family efflux transporter [Bacteroidetes bacterium]|nr:MATE family efflux transporter [Bacteroidota bacterium]
MLDLRYRTILGVALPLMATSFIQSVVLITDTAFLSRWDTLSFDASGNAGLIYITLFMCLVGIGDGSQILQAQKIGEKNGSQLKKILLNTYFINLIVGIALTFIAYQLVRDFVLSYARNPILGNLQADFLETRIWGLPFVAITLSTSAYFNAKGETWKVLICAGITAVSNVLMDYYFIFGTSNMAPMGLKGAALASALADGLGCVCSLVILYYSPKDLIDQAKERLSIQASELWKITKISAPLAMQGILALSTWTLFFTWVEQKSTFDLTISQNIRAIYFIAFVPIFGFASTTRIYISQYVGAKKFEMIPIIQKRIILLTLGFLFLMLHGNLFYPELLIELINPVKVYQKTSAEILTLIFGSILIYAVGSIFFQSINGLGRTRITFVIELISVSVYLSAAYLFIKIFAWDIWKIWLVEYIYFGVFAIASIMYLAYFNYKRKKI